MADAGVHGRRRVPSASNLIVQRGSSASSSRRRLHRGTPKPSLGQPRSRRPVKIVRRVSCESSLWSARLIPDSSRGGGEVTSKLAGIDDSSIGGQHPKLLARPHTSYDLFSPETPLSPSSTGQQIPKLLARPHTWSDLLSSQPPLLPSLSRHSPLDEGVKVVVSVTVEGSVGPVKTMLRLGASVEEAIAAVLEKYRREGRLPRLDQAAASSFDLHYSHFSLESLSKSDKIGEVGSRTFYLRTNSGRNNICFRREDSNLSIAGSENRVINEKSHEDGPHQLFIAFIVQRFEKIGRRTRKLWRIMSCIVCV